MSDILIDELNSEAAPNTAVIQMRQDSQLQPPQLGFDSGDTTSFDSFTTQRLYVRAAQAEHAAYNEGVTLEDRTLILGANVARMWTMFDMFVRASHRTGGEKGTNYALQAALYKKDADDMMQEVIKTVSAEVAFKVFNPEVYTLANIWPYRRWPVL